MASMSLVSMRVSKGSYVLMRWSRSGVSASAKVASGSARNAAARALASIACTSRDSISAVAGVHCDGQVLVLHDLLGIAGNVQPRFVKQYAQVGTVIREAVEDYAREVREGKFPGPEHSFAPEERAVPFSTATNKS